MRIQIITVLMLFMLPLVHGMEECQREESPSSIPCNIISSWDYANDCTTYNITIYNGTGQEIQNRSLEDFGQSPFCNVSFNISTKGTYSYNISSGDTGTIIIKDMVDDMILSLGVIIGTSVIAFLLLYFTFNIDKEYYLFKLLVSFFAMSCFIIIAKLGHTISVGQTYEVTALLAYKVVLWVVQLYGIFVFMYFMYWVFKKFGWLGKQKRGVV